MMSCITNVFKTQTLFIKLKEYEDVIFFILTQFNTHYEFMQDFI